MNESDWNEVNEKWNDEDEKEKWKKKGIKEIEGNEKRIRNNIKMKYKWIWWNKKNEERK